MKYCRFLAIVLTAATLALTAYSDDGGDNGGTTPVIYAIGDTGPSGVGIVFYVTDGGLHGLEVAPVDQSTSAAWSTITGTLIGTTGTAIGTGSDNTDDIITQNTGAASAAKICRDYRAAQEGDWFLPSRYELNAIWVNLVDNGSGANSGVGGFAGGSYWSSSEDDASDAWSQGFGDGSQDGGSKVSFYRVRAVRAF